MVRNWRTLDTTSSHHENLVTINGGFGVLHVCGYFCGECCIHSSITLATSTMTVSLRKDLPHWINIFENKTVVFSTETWHLKLNSDCIVSMLSQSLLFSWCDEKCNIMFMYSFMNVWLNTDKLGVNISNKKYYLLKWRLLNLFYL